MRTALFFLLIALLAPSLAEAQRVMHRVRFGESLASISKYYYGKRIFADVIKAANNVSQNRKIKAGDRIRIPTAWVHVVRKSTTVRQLAKRFLGDARRWPALGMANKLGRRKRIRKGARVVIPYVMRHRVDPEETFSLLSQRYYGTDQYATLIASYNFIAGERPAPNSQIEIPIGSLRILPIRLEELTNEHVLGISHKSNQEIRQALQEANALLRRGEYWSVPLRIVRLLTRDHTSDVDVAQVFKLLAIAYVAVDRVDLAVNSFHEALIRLPTMTLDPVTTSPKVIRAFVDAKTRMNRRE